MMILTHLRTPRTHLYPRGTASQLALGSMAARPGRALTLGSIDLASCGTHAEHATGLKGGYGMNAMGAWDVA